MDLRTRIVYAARECLGTRFRLQGRRPGVGLDCFGVVLWPQRRLMGIMDDFVAYGPTPHPSIVFETLDRMFLRIDTSDVLPGDIMLMYIERHPQHMGIYTGKTLIHALAKGPNAVVEHEYGPPWSDNLVAAYRYRWVGD